MPTVFPVRAARLPRPSRVRPAAFTLVELLVVIGIIALLIGILLPALSRAQEASRTVKCLSNLRSILQAANIYSSEHKNIVLPAATDKAGWWWNILVDDGYIQAPDGNGRGPMGGSVLYCPSGNMDLFPPTLDNNTTVPASRVDDTNCMPYRSTSPRTGKVIDCWYGVNGNEGNTTTTGTPCRRIQTYPTDGYLSMSAIRRSAEMVMFFDGVVYHHMHVNANRLSARHGRKTETNVAFFDGHVQTIKTETLPGGLGAAQISDFSVANLKAKYPPPASPMWWLEQQY